MSDDLQVRLQQASSKEEVTEIMADHEKKMADALDHLDKQKTDQMNTLTNKLAQRRKDRTAALRRQHKAEVRAR